MCLAVNPTRAPKLWGEAGTQTFLLQNISLLQVSPTTFAVVGGRVDTGKSLLASEPACGSKADICEPRQEKQNLTLRKEVTEKTSESKRVWKERGKCNECNGCDGLDGRKWVEVCGHTDRTMTAVTVTGACPHTEVEI
jgi:hypothetical protein